MPLLIAAYVAVTTRLARLNSPENRDRGESPVSTVIIIAGLAILAIGVLAWAGDKALEYMDDPTGGLPAAPAVP
ncbi:hypothetical protein J2S43_008273 [Catenuloplanes nepalensis]|uniref:Uncharacterized protein n=1 Tax=Catenuloplanes nepalensis TaxID=587533 RepID=A0ABT9N950_9ACTN|nr:hypothetical protein [Catenuloplanes nepalensis]MDP9799761.1 hypothetical protein [Catenuloplanes nepalensis]